MTYAGHDTEQYPEQGEGVEPEAEAATESEGENEEQEEQSEHDLYMESLTQITDKDHDEMFGTKGITDVDEGDDDFSDLVDVDEADIMGYDEPEPPKKRYRTVPRRSGTYRLPPTPPTSIGGMRS